LDSSVVEHYTVNVGFEEVHRFYKNDEHKQKLVLKISNQMSH